jgi:hypothetical protein
VRSRRSIRYWKVVILDQGEIRVPSCHEQMKSWDEINLWLWDLVRLALPCDQRGMRKHDLEWFGGRL